MKRFEEPADVLGQHLRRLPGGVVTADVVRMPLHNILVVAFREAADGLEVIGEARETDWNGRRLLRGLRLGVFVVKTDRRPCSAT
jgi:hypothetical protein